MKKIDNKAELERMIRKYLSGKATPEEEAFLDSYFQYFDKREEVLDTISEAERQHLKQEMEANILERISTEKQPKVRTLSMVMKIAAAILVFLSVGLYVYYANEKASESVVANRSSKSDIGPGGNKALLTLADGRKISLDNMTIGELTKEGNTIIKKSKDGQLIYDLSALTANKNTSVASNTIETPRGGEYQVILPDGTKVWLNAESKLVFPVAFHGKERRVELRGEAYFEVAHNKKMPFRVVSGDQLVEVLGTHFNISAYAAEATKTTLLEGSVRVSKGGADSEILKPGQQSLIEGNTGIYISDVNAADAIAWKNGYFVFANEGVESVMRKISRWYNVDVEYKGKITNEKFIGTVSRFEKISEVLAVLELTGLVHFKVEGRRVVVMP